MPNTYVVLINTLQLTLDPQKNRMLPNLGIFKNCGTIQKDDEEPEESPSVAEHVKVETIWFGSIYGFCFSNTWHGRRALSTYHPNSAHTIQITTS